MSLLNLQFPAVLADFSNSENFKLWKVVNDGVMGGESIASFEQTAEGNALFKGHVSLENNGGFSSVRYSFDKKALDKKVSKICIKLKGDQKNYQLRVKNDQSERHAYKFEFATSGEWETIEIKVTDMSPTYRGMAPNLPNYKAETLGEIGFLIANKKQENFALVIAKIWIE